MVMVLLMVVKDGDFRGPDFLGVCFENPDKNKLLLFFKGIRSILLRCYRTQQTQGVTQEVTWLETTTLQYDRKYLFTASYDPSFKSSSSYKQPVKTKRGTEN